MKILGLEIFGSHPPKDSIAQQQPKAFKPPETPLNPDVATQQAVDAQATAGSASEPSTIPIVPVSTEAPPTPVPAVDGAAERQPTA